MGGNKSGPGEAEIALKILAVGVELGSCCRSRWESRRGRECLAASVGHAINIALGETLIGFVLKQ